MYILINFNLSRLIVLINIKSRSNISTENKNTK